MSFKSVPLGTACLGFEKAVPNGTPKMIHYNFYKQIVLTGHSFCVTSVISRTPKINFWLLYLIKGNLFY
jgi:hypothetical protein